MRSATSFFDKTLFRSQLKHTWPLWLGYTALWLFLVPVMLFSELSAYQGGYSAADASYLLLNTGVRGGIFISFFFGLFFAMLAFSHLTQSRASAHFVVGLKGEILQCVPLTEIAYCSNTANDYTVSIEVCHPDDTGKFNDATMESLEQLVAWLCETFSLDPAEDVIRHYDVTGKICPKYYVENEDAWLAFREDVSARIEEDKTANGETN